MQDKYQKDMMHYSVRLEKQKEKMRDMKTELEESRINLKKAEDFQQELMFGI